MTPKDLREKSLPEMAGMVERRITDILIILEQIVFEADPKNEEVESDIFALSELQSQISSAYDRAKPSLNELQG